MEDCKRTVKRKKNKTEKQDDVIKSKIKSEEESKKPIDLKYGPLPTFTNQRIWSRAILILGASVVVYFTSKSNKEISFAKQRDLIESRQHNVICSEDYKSELDKFPGCVPEICGRYVTDKLITETEANELLEVAKKAFSLSVSEGGASIVDLHSGALSMGKVFVNIYKLESGADLFSEADFFTYKSVRTKIQNLVSQHFKISPNSLFLTHPTFFSRLTSKDAVTPHDEYWHPHVDKETYKSFHFTSLLYLNDFGLDFNGGRFVFIEKNNNTLVVEPKKGRVSTFTSGGENVHYVERVKSGIRYALTVSFTCDIKHAIKDPNIFS